MHFNYILWQHYCNGTGLNVTQSPKVVFFGVLFFFFFFCGGGGGGWGLCSTVLNKVKLKHV